MLTWDQAIAVAEAYLKREDKSQAVAESTTSIGPERFVVGPWRGWDPLPTRFIKRAKVSEHGVEMLQIGWSP